MKGELAESMERRQRMRTGQVQGDSGGGECWMTEGGLKGPQASRSTEMESITVPDGERVTLA